MVSGYLLILVSFSVYLSDTSKVSTKSPIMEEKVHPNGQVCVINDDCSSKCCVYANAVSGVCLPQAPIGQVCGFVLGAGKSLQDHYRLCEDCDTFCCCGSGCCPTSYCVAALKMNPTVCTKCNTGCCCTEDITMSSSSTCCPVPYCAASPGLTSIQGEPCNRCPSGCCCGDKCCLSSFCKGSTVGQFCQTCGSGCCCGKLCCAVSFCDTSSLSMTRLLSLYGANAPMPPSRMPYDSIALAFPKPVDIKDAFPAEGPSSVYLPALTGGTIMEGQRTPSRPCLQCTTGCCCMFGCCNTVYCASSDGASVLFPQVVPA